MNSELSADTREWLAREDAERKYLLSRGLTRPEALRSTPEEWPGRVWYAHRDWEDNNGKVHGIYVSLRHNHAIPVAWYTLATIDDEPDSVEHRVLSRQRGIELAIAIARDFGAIDHIGRDEIEDLRLYGRPSSKKLTPDWLYEITLTEFDDDRDSIYNLHPYCPQRFRKMVQAAMPTVGFTATLDDGEGNVVTLDASGEIAVLENGEESEGKAAAAA